MHSSSLDPVTGLLWANENYASRFSKGTLQMGSRTGVTILTCADARVDPALFLGLREGDATVFRNAGGRVTNDFLRLLLVSQTLGSRRVMVIHHTDCALNRFSNTELRQQAQIRLGLDASKIDFLAFANVDESVREDVLRLRTSPSVRRDTIISGFVYDVSSGRLREVHVA